MAAIPEFARLTEETLAMSTKLHNQFAPDTAFPNVDLLCDEFRELCAILARYDMQSRFRLRLLHRHTTISEGQILLGTSIVEPSGYWIRPVYIRDVNLQSIHGSIFSVDATSFKNKGDMMYALLPSEFREGRTEIDPIDVNFVMEFTNHIRAKGWENTFGLEAIQDQVGKMVEFTFDIGSLLLEDDRVESEVRKQFNLQETGWAIKVDNGVVDATGETRCVTYITGHVKITNSQINDVADAIKSLRHEGLLVV